MDFGTLKDIGSAFLVGATVLLILEAYLYFCSNWTITGFFRLPLGIDKPVGNKPDGVQLGAFVAIATIAGVLCQAAFQPVIDDGDELINKVPGAVSETTCPDGVNGFGCIPSESTKTKLRLSVLYKLSEVDKANVHPSAVGKCLLKNGDESKCISAEATSLLKDLVARNLHVRYCREHLQYLDSRSVARALFEESRLGQKTDRPYSDCFTDLYYISKNWAFSKDHHFDELSRILMRLEFARSFSLVAIALIPWGVVFMFSSLAVRLFEMNLARETYDVYRHRQGGPSGLNKLEKFFWNNVDRHLGGSIVKAWIVAMIVGALLVLIGATIKWLIDLWLVDTERLMGNFLFEIASAIAALVAVMLVRGASNVQWRSVTQMTLLVTTLSAVLFVGHTVGYFAYAWDQKELTKRTFGYFVTNDRLK